MATETYRVNANVRLSHKNHEALLRHIKDRLDFGNSYRKTRIERYAAIDRELMGYIKLSDEDKRRERDNLTGKGPKLTNTVLPLTAAQLNDLVTFLMSVFAPDTGMYSAIAPQEKNNIAQGFAKLHNKQAKIFKHYPHLAKCMFDIAKYNFGGLTVKWEQIIGNKVVNTNAGGVDVEHNVVTFEGNELEAVDPYNFIYDISVPLHKLAVDGEFFAIPKLVRPFHIRRMEANEEIYDAVKIMNTTAGTMEYYQQKPEIFIDHSGNFGGIKDWSAFLQGHQGQTIEDIKAVEYIDFYGWVVPKEFGLSKDENYQIYHFILINNQRIVFAEPLNNAHGFLPCACSRVFEDGFGDQSKSQAETLFPYQRAASFTLNIHGAAMRKGVFGLTVYNRQLLPDMSNLDGAAGRIPMDAPTRDFDVRKGFQQYTDRPDTSNTAEQIRLFHDLMQQILPTDMMRQVASLERATQYQAAATVQGSNRRNHMIAKFIDFSCLNFIRLMIHFNTLQYQQQMEIFDDNGNVIQIDPTQFREVDMDLVMGGGLLTVDKLMIIEGMKDLINMMLQSQIAVEKIDIVALINYWTTMLGDVTDLNQFKYEDPFDQLPKEQKQMAWQLLQQAMQQQQQGATANVPGNV